LIEFLAPGDVVFTLQFNDTCLSHAFRVFPNGGRAKRLELGRYGPCEKVTSARFMRDNRSLAYIALAGLALLWGYNWVVMKIAVQYAPPIEFAALRMLLGAAVLFAALLVTRKSLRPQRPPQFFWIGLFQSGGFVALATWAVLISGAGKVADLSYTMPLWVAIAGWPLLG